MPASRAAMHERPSIAAVVLLGLHMPPRRRLPHTLAAGTRSALATTPSCAALFASACFDGSAPATATSFVHAALLTALAAANDLLATLRPRVRRGDEHDVRRVVRPLWLLEHAAGLPGRVRNLLRWRAASAVTFVSRHRPRTKRKPHSCASRRPAHPRRAVQPERFLLPATQPGRRPHLLQQQVPPTVRGLQTVLPGRRIGGAGGTAERAGATAASSGAESTRTPLER
mmetsp:Transcript_10647/g.20574  ORF Transcript_10647/g.20574 Transcript_10647/m.20574 type:complete len:228 (-) Transcript_10647:185-868(-)